MTLYDSITAFMALIVFTALIVGHIVNQETLIEAKYIAKTKALTIIVQKQENIIELLQEKVGDCEAHTGCHIERLKKCEEIIKRNMDEFN